jgi:hypothetical protein
VILDGRCAAPKDPKPGVTTYFCVYPAGHDGPHSWRETLKLAINALNTRGTAAPSESAITALAVVRAYIASDDRQLSLLRGAT